ncbi:hypothetical protein AB0O01_00790 [Streptomyces sp. NPDC093252]|uniref:hypothetical protein n=1 Tax=Streptomyces sp. NPDC093252 TaxID=3154980 RepID=UPI003420A8AA
MKRVMDPLARLVAIGRSLVTGSRRTDVHARRAREALNRPPAPIRPPLDTDDSPPPPAPRW